MTKQTTVVVIGSLWVNKLTESLFELWVFTAFFDDFSLLTLVVWDMWDGLMLSQHCWLDHSIDQHLLKETEQSEEKDS